jgi:hypothetical protein
MLKIEGYDSTSGSAAAALNASNKVVIIGFVQPLSLAGSFIVSVRTPFLSLLNTSGALVVCALFDISLALVGCTRFANPVRRAERRTSMMN